MIMWIQHEISITSKQRGFHLITRSIEQAIPEISRISTGLLHVFIKHTSASLTISENADPSVRVDLEAYFSRLAPENQPYYTHTYEGSDDMPSHLKNCILGSSLTIPITNGQMNLGTWQGIYLCEHRNHASNRRLVLTIQGE